MEKSLGLIDILSFVHDCIVQIVNVYISFAKMVKLYVHVGGNLLTKGG